MSKYIVYDLIWDPAKRFKIRVPEEPVNSLQHTPALIVSSSSSDMELECSARPDSICSTYLSIIHEFIDHDVTLCVP